jgi:hypothetical protein
MKGWIAFAVATVLFPSSAWAEETKPSSGKLVCESTPSTGSRVARTRICMTKDQWRTQREALSQELTERHWGGGQKGPETATSPTDPSTFGLPK